MKNKRFLIGICCIGMFVVGLVAFYYVTTYFQALRLEEVPLNLVGACAGALVSAIITLIITLLVVGTQAKVERDKDLDKERFSVLFAQKAKTYEAYLENLREFIKDGEFSADEEQELIDDLNFKLEMYLAPGKDGNSAKDRIAASIKEMASNRDDPIVVGNCVQAILHVLRDDLRAQV
jgi:polyhydroxyalkanoate synthesis regulator phasin